MFNGYAQPAHLFIPFPEWAWLDCWIRGYHRPDWMINLNEQSWEKNRGMVDPVYMDYMNPV